MSDGATLQWRRILAGHAASSNAGRAAKLNGRSCDRRFDAGQRVGEQDFTDQRVWLPALA
jgi:hypothetical protein